MDQIKMVIRWIEQKLKTRTWIKIVSPSVSLSSETAGVANLTRTGAETWLIQKSFLDAT